MNRSARDVVKGILGIAAGAAAIGHPSAAAAQFDGRWLMTIHSTVAIPVIFEIDQAGNALSFTLLGAQFQGTVTGDTFRANAPPTPGPFFPNGAFMRASLLALPGHAIAGMQNSASPPGFVTMQRCNCVDDDPSDGDGCAGRCLVGPCETCGGDPYVCTQLPDGAPCEDGRACTSGESCLAGECGGGGPVTPCVDLSGRWHLESMSSLGNSEGDAPVTQTGNYLEHSGCAGSIDPATGSYQMLCTHIDIQSFSSCPFGARIGQGGLDSSTFTDSFSPYLFSLAEGGCAEIGIQTTATRVCGDGSVDPGDECDDGDVEPGDGCDAFCRIEPCWTCAPGEPSSCTPVADGERCGDGDDCTSGDSCQAGFCEGGTLLECGACEACGPLGCIGAPLSDCRQTTLAKRTTLQVRNPDASARGDKIAWKWSAGEATAENELADPLAGADYSLCVFDESAATPTLLARAGAAAGDQCGGAPCWQRKPNGELVYRNPDNAGGLRLLRVRPGAEGEARVLLRGKGPIGSAPDALPATPLPLPLLVQLQGEGGACFEARFEAAGQAINDGRGFKGNASDPP